MIKDFIQILKRSWGSHFWINLATTGVLALSFGLIFGCLLFSQNISKLFTVWGEDIQITGYLQDNITSEQRANIELKLKSFESVSNYSFVDREAAAHIFERSLKSYGPQFLSSLKNDVGNPFPASYQIQLKEEFRKPNTIDEIASEMQAMPGVEDVSFGQEWVKNYTLLARYGKAIGIVGGLVILISCLLTVSNSIRASLQTRQEEIEILELIGATANIIRKPFLLEGAFQGGLASGLALLILSVVYSYSIHILNGILGSGSMTSLLSFFPLFTAMLLIAGGTVIGASGSYICVARINSGWAASEGTRK